MPSEKNNEVAPEQSTPQSNSQEPDLTSVAPTKDNYTTDKKNNQPTDDINIDELKSIVKEDPTFLNKLRNAEAKKFEGIAYENKKLRVKEAAQWLINKFHIIKINDLLHIYRQGIYVNDISSIEMVIRHWLPKAKSVEIKSVLTEISSSAPARKESHYKYVAFANKVIDIMTLEDYEFDPDKFIITSRVYAVYDSKLLDTDNSNVEFINTYFNNLSCGDRELTELYLEIIGYSMLRSHKHQLGFLLKGSSFNGKSIYLKLIEKLSRKFCSHLNLAQLSTMKSLGGLYHRTCNIIDDTGDPKKLDLELVQSVVGGFTIELPTKDNSQFTFETNATIIMATTKYLNFKDFNKSLTRRFIVVPFYANFEHNRNDNIEEEVLTSENLSVIAIMALRAYNKVVADGEFHIPEFVKDETKSYFNNENPLLEFIESHPIKRLFLRSEYLERYSNWCQNIKGIDKPNKAVVGKAINNLGYKTSSPSINGERKDYYFAPDYNIQKFRAEYDDYKSSLPEGEVPKRELDYLMELNEEDIKKLWKD